MSITRQKKYTSPFHIDNNIEGDICPLNGVLQQVNNGTKYIKIKDSLAWKNEAF